MNLRSIQLFLVAFTAWTINAGAQNMPVGQWQSHLPYNTAVSIATDGVQIFVGGQYGFYTLSIANSEVTKYSKVNGMSDLGIAKIAYDAFSDAVILTYENSNIDIFKNGTFYNIPDLKLKTFTSSKQVNHIYTEDGLAYLSTDVGIIVININEKEIKETYTFSKNSENIAIKGLTTADNFLYAATSNGIYRAPKNSPTLQDFQEWTPLDSTRSFIAAASNGLEVFIANSDTVFVINNDTLNTVYTSEDSVLVNLEDGVSSIWIMEYSDTTFTGRALRMNPEYLISDTLNTGGEAYELLDVADADSSKWIANINDGLKRRTQKGIPFNTVIPEGPSGVSSFDIKANDKQLLVAHGGYDDTYRPLNLSGGFSIYNEGEWESYELFEYPPFGDSIRDISHILQMPDGTIYAGSSQSGLFVLNPDKSYEIYKQNSFIDPSSTGSTLYRVSGLALDNDGVLWMTVFGGSPNELVSRTPDGRWTQYSIPISRSIAHSAIHLLVDDNNQKWFAAPGDGGVIVYDDNRTPLVKNDDSYTQLLAGEGSGGLPNNTVLCMANDKDGAIWIGTANGIGIVNCPSLVIQRQCEAEQRIVQFDQFAGYLFQNEQVRTIAVDGANRKWIGTNNGVWLISESGDEIIERFTTDNSPLPSDFIQKITVDPITGDVYIGTERGLMSYRGTAVDGGTENNDLIVYPNPIPSGYSGTIAIKGFVENADVKITDVSGQLVYKTTALGGQAIWNGTDYTGRRPQSGVYLIFGTNKDGTETVKGKMVFME